MDKVDSMEEKINLIFSDLMEKQNKKKKKSSDFDNFILLLFFYSNF